MTSDQNQEIIAMQFRANQAGLAGTVVPVWNTGGESFRFIAPPNWRPFFQSISCGFIASNINKTVNW